MKNTVRSSIYCVVCLSIALSWVIALVGYAQAYQHLWGVALSVLTFLLVIAIVPIGGIVIIVPIFYVYRCISHCVRKPAVTNGKDSLRDSRGEAGQVLPAGSEPRRVVTR